MQTKWKEQHLIKTHLWCFFYFLQFLQKTLKRLPPKIHLYQKTVGQCKSPPFKAQGFCGVPDVLEPESAGFNTAVTSGGVPRQLQQLLPGFGSRKHGHYVVLILLSSCLMAGKQDGSHVMWLHHTIRRIKHWKTGAQRTIDDLVLHLVQFTNDFFQDFLSVRRCVWVEAHWKTLWTSDGRIIFTCFILSKSKASASPMLPTGRTLRSGRKHFRCCKVFVRLSLQ